jgi:uncharacterized protein (TIGR01777 family)
VERVLVTGVSGPIGAVLLPYLESQGAHIFRLVRGPVRGADQISWDPLQPILPDSVSGFDAVVHLAGESIVGRWTDDKKKRVRESRVLGTRHLATALSQTSRRPRVFICASAVGYYGNRGEEILIEESPGGQGFLADVSRAWEEATRPAAEAAIRTVNLRIGLVLSPKGGALGKMLTPFRLGLGGKIGSGQQWWSWIHVDDIVGAVHYAMHAESLSGPVNLVSPSAVQNVDFTRILASVLGRPTLLPLPAFVARLAFGAEMADELLLSSAHVEPGRLRASGYSFRFPELRVALDDLLG